MSDERPQRPFVPRGAGPGGRPAFNRPGPGGFTPRPAPGGFTPRPPFPSTVQRPAPVAESVHSVRVRDGERELEVHGTPMFCRQVLDELPPPLARPTAHPPPP